MAKGFTITPSSQKCFKLSVFDAHSPDIKSVSHYYSMEAAIAEAQAQVKASRWEDVTDECDFHSNCGPSGGAIIVVMHEGKVITTAPSFEYKLKDNIIYKWR